MEVGLKTPFHIRRNIIRFSKIPELKKDFLFEILIRFNSVNPLEYFCGIEGHIALDINLRQAYNTLFLRLIPGDLSSARQFNTLPGLLDIRAALSDSYPNAHRSPPACFSHNGWRSVHVFSTKNTNHMNLVVFLWIRRTIFQIRKHTI